MSAAIEIITSRQNQGVCLACKLSDKKHREAERKFRIDGIKLFEEAVLSNAELETVFVRQSSIDRMMPRIEKNLSDLNIVKIVSDGVFEKISEEKSPEGIICIAKYIDNLHKIIKINNEIIIDGYSSSLQMTI
jgi:TrmH family RNA methyltransferase